MFGIVAKSISNRASVERVIHRRFATAASEDDLLSVSLLVPHKPIFTDKKVRFVSIPGSSGYFTVMKRSNPSVSELKAGLLTINEDNVKREKYFVSGGFSFVHSDNTCVINAVEAVPLEHLDLEAAQLGLARFTDEATKATDNETRAKALIGVEVYRSMCWALGK